VKAANASARERPDRIDLAQLPYMVGVVHLRALSMMVVSPCCSARLVDEKQQIEGHDPHRRGSPAGTGCGGGRLGVLALALAANPHVAQMCLISLASEYRNVMRYRAPDGSSLALWSYADHG
jgi:hypothetical protein